MINEEAKYVGVLAVLIVVGAGILNQLSFKTSASQMAAISGSGSGLVAYYAFDGGPGTTAGDSAGTNTGTLTNGPTWSAGKVGSGSMSFDGVNDHVLLNSSSIIGTGDATACAWIYPRSSAPGRF